MSRSKQKIDRSIAIDNFAWSCVLYVLGPGLFLGGLAVSFREGITIQALAFSLFWGLGGILVAGMHLHIAEKVGAGFLKPVIGIVSAAIGLSYLAASVHSHLFN